MAYTPYQKKQPTYPGIFEGVTSDMLAANEGSGTTGKGKAKYTMSKVFDESGETLTETNVDEDGSETKVVKKTPSDLLANQTFLSDDMDLSFESIATPPEADPTEEERLAKLYQEQREAAGVRDLGVRRSSKFENDNNNQLPTNVSPFFSMKDDRYLLNHEYYGDGKASQFPSLPAETSIGKSLFGNIVVDQSGSTVENDTGTLAITDPDRADAQTAIIESYNNQDMMELYNTRPDLYAKVVSGEIPMEQREDPHEGKSYTAPGFDGSELHAAEVALATEEKIKEEEKKLEENFEDLPWAGDKGIDLTAVVQEIKDTDPKAIEVLNEFASWADTVTDEVAIKEAEDYLLSLKESPSVDSRFRKAMAIGMIAMLFGDDFTTAMNTGFGVVADDYAAEAEEAKTEAETAAALAKIVAAEQRAAEEWDRRTIIDAEIAYQKELRATNATRSKEAFEAQQEISSDNFAYIQDRADKYWKGLSDKAKEKFENINDFQIQMDQAMDWMTRNWSGQVDFGNSSNQRVGFENAFSKWMQDKQMFDTADFQTYIQDAFIKIKFAAGADGSDATYIEPSLISPDRDTLIKDGQYSQKKVARAKESVANLYKKVENQIIPAVGTEKHALMLLKKDFNDFKNYEFDGTPVAKGEVSKRYAKLESASYDVGEGVFTRFVNQLPANSVWGMVHDPSAKGKSAKQLQDAIVDYIANN